MKKLNLLSRLLCVFFAIQMALPASLLAQLLISGPTFPTTNTVHFDLTGAQSTNAHSRPTCQVKNYTGAL